MAIIPQFKNIINYIEDNMKTFKQSAFNELDALVFTWLSYYHVDKEIYKQKSFDKIYLKDFYNAKYFYKMTYDVFDIPNSKKMLSLIAASPRFRDAEMFYFIENINKQIEKQFAAMTFEYEKGKYFVAYRGTDHSFVGWKEDFNMSFLKYVPAQVEAKKYLEDVIKKKPGSYIVGGHSKGGNLAMYAASFVDEKYRKNIKCIYNFDGPSLNSKLISDKRYISIKKLIKKYVPQSSVVGMCFEKTTNYKIIKSNSVGVLQHNPFTWGIDGNKLTVLKDSTFDSKAFKTGINALINTLSEEELKLFVDTLYGVVEATKADTAELFLKNLSKNTKIVFEAINKFNDEQKNLMGKVVKIYITEVFNSVLPNNSKVKFVGNKR